MVAVPLFALVTNWWKHQKDKAGEDIAQTARTLARTPRALDPGRGVQQTASGGATSVPPSTATSTGTASEAHRVRDLLTPLAWAEGAGLPRELWAPLATALADDEDYADDDITWLLEQAGFYLVEAHRPGPISVPPLP